MDSSVGDCDGLSRVQRELVARNLGLVRLHLRRRVHLPRTATRNRETEDLYQEGCVGLIRAAMTYDATRHGSFETYALVRIRKTVHRAIHERFATLRIPVGVIGRRKAAEKQGRGKVGPGFPAVFSASRVGSVSRSPGISAEESAETIRTSHDGASPVAHGAETLSQHLLAKHRIALAMAVNRVAGRCRRRGVRAILDAIVAERLGVPCEDARTSLRAIGRRFNVSTGRAVVWQRGLVREARRVLGEDAEFALLRRAAAEAGEGNDRALEGGLRAELAAARSAAFKRALAGRDLAGRALVLLAVLRRVGKEASEEAGQLFATLPCDMQREVLAAVSDGSHASERGEVVGDGANGMLLE